MEPKQVQGVHNEEEQVEDSDVELEQVQGAHQEEGQVQVSDMEPEQLQRVHQEEKQVQVSVEVGGGVEEAGSVSAWSPGPGWKSSQARGLCRDYVANKYEIVKKSTDEDMSVA